MNTTAQVEKEREKYSAFLDSHDQIFRDLSQLLTDSTLLKIGVNFTM